MAAHRKTDPEDFIVLGEARQNNLKGIDLRIPKRKLTVFTGVSGSGKSSVVFDTIAIESQRQLNETLPAFVRNRMPKYERPDAEVMKNLSTAIVIDQRQVGGNARSTVGTMTEILPMLRVLFSRAGSPGAGPSHLYSYNDPRGMCEACQGLGTTVRLELDRLLDESRSLNEGAIGFPSFAVGTFQWQLYGESGLFDPDLPLRDFSAKDRELLLYGQGFTVDRAYRNGVQERVRGDRQALHPPVCQTRTGPREGQGTRGDRTGGDPGPLRRLPRRASSTRRPSPRASTGTTSRTSPRWRSPS